MKPLSEFAEELREMKAHTYSSENAEVYRAFDAGMFHAGALLQAWLREADSEEMPDWFENTLKDLFPNAEHQTLGARVISAKVNAHWLKVGLGHLWRKVRHELLSTTRQKDSP